MIPSLGHESGTHCAAMLKTLQSKTTASFPEIQVLQA